MVASCNRKAIYSHYEHTPLAGWEKNDTLIFGISPVKEDGIYHEEVGLRINDLYPFMSLNLVVEQMNVTQGTLLQRDTLNCSLVERDGRVKGRGVSFYQYNFHLNDLNLVVGDSFAVYIRHNMKREILPGIADVGIQLTKME
jgi:gliding motility-associated lipoprotein GldH